MKWMWLGMFFFGSLMMAESSDDLTPGQIALIKDLERSLMAPCCWSGTVYDHGHSELEEQIESFVRVGQSKDQVLDYYVKQYGERILAIPVASGFNLFAWIAPVVIAGIALLILILYLKSPKEVPEEVVSTSTNIPYDTLIEKELKELD